MKGAEATSGDKNEGVEVKAGNRKSGVVSYDNI
jgi:hypothetical protein